MSRLDKLIAQLCPDGVEYKSLGEIAIKMYRGSGIKRNQITDTGTPCVRYGEIYTTYNIWFDSCVSRTDPTSISSKKYFEYGDILFAITGESVVEIAKSCAYTGHDKCLAGGDIVVMKHNENAKYLAYALFTSSAQAQKVKGRVKSKVVHSNIPAISKIKIPLPPLPIQEEIVRILDRFTELETELETELDLRKKQYEYYRINLLKPKSNNKNVKWLSLADICKKISSGGTPLKSHQEYYHGNIPWLRTQEVKFNYITKTENSISQIGLENSSAKWIPSNCVIVAISGATAGRCAINKIPLTTNQHCCNLEINETLALYKYVFFWICQNYEQLKDLGQGARNDLNVSIISQYPIPLPPLSEQERIVNILDRFDALTNDISVGLPAEIAARHKQYEYYRDTLLSFKEKVS